MWTAQEEIVTEYFAQTFERLADRGLSQAKFTRYRQGLAVPQKAKKHQQERQAEPPEFGFA